VASLSAQIASLSTSQKSQLSAKLKPMIGPLVAMAPFAAPLISSFVNAAPGAIAVVIKPVEGMLPPKAKSMIQSAITQVIGSTPKKPAPTRTTRMTRYKPPTSSGGGTFTPAPVSTGGGLSMPVKIGIGVAVLGGIYLATRKRK
jgi:hypothetical protein